ncbi:MAG: 4Fe-4S dicluster domain-containing protein, partial [Myxococcota bacterium]|nr:4Fe-4S dicluster domain-containing protein [Myxococcota bacterium]
EMPAVVFVTAFDEHAIRAFDVNAVDYLLKPFDRVRFERSLARARRAVALPPGPGLSSRRAVATASAVLVLNHVTGAVGSAMKVPPPQEGRRPSYRDVLALTQAMQDGKVGVLLIHDANPVYSLPRTAGFREALEKVGLVVSFSSARDETAVLADLVLPDHAPLESWGDRRPRPGVRALVQPTFRPLHDTRALGDAVLDLGRAMGDGVASKLPSGSFRQVLEDAWSDVDFREALRRGGVFDETPHRPVSFQAASLEVVAPKMTGEGEFTLMAYPHAFLGDGRGAPLPWLQEIPDPVTSVAWESWAEVSLATAERLGVEAGDVVALETSAGRIEAAVYPRGGIRDDVVAVPIGQGHTVGHFASKAGQGMPGTPRGVNVAEALPAAVDEKGGRAWLTEKARLTPTGRHRRLPLLQTNDNKRGRQLGEAITLATLLEAATGKGGHGADHGGGHGGGAAAAAGVEAHHGDVDPGEPSHGEGEHGSAHEHEIRHPYDPADDARDEQFMERFPDAVGPSPYRWGMTIDLDRCTGCSACIAACYIENNVPVVGEEETRRNRQMTWLRIDRWVGEGEPVLEAGRRVPPRNNEKLGHTDVRNSPMLCQHCGAAPCEPVCPVIATYHNPEGLNAMIYNRCIGTRYCANNCPYKVRRFNYWDHQLTKWPSPMQLGLNPDVTVRGQGVMEKCTFCIQRIQAARQDAKNAGHEIRDGAVETACQQTCPSEAITFGNLRDEDSEVVRKASDEKRGYHALHVLNTRPAITYLAKVIRGPVEGS